MYTVSTKSWHVSDYVNRYADGPNPSSSPEFAKRIHLLTNDGRNHVKNVICWNQSWIKLWCFNIKSFFCHISRLCGHPVYQFCIWYLHIYAFCCLGYSITFKFYILQMSCRGITRQSAVFYRLLIHCLAKVWKRRNVDWIKDR